MGTGRETPLEGSHPLDRLLDISAEARGPLSGHLSQGGRGPGALQHDVKEPPHSFYLRFPRNLRHSPSQEKRAHLLVLETELEDLVGESLVSGRSDETLQNPRDVPKVLRTIIGAIQIRHHLEDR